MTRLSLRLTLLLVSLAALGYAAYLTWSSEQQSRQIVSAGRQFDSAARAAAINVAELRAAQQAYVAVGQGQDFWFARATALAKELGDNLSYLKSIASQPAVPQALDDASAALQDFEQMDRRARDYARGHQLTAASNLVFTEGVDLTKKAADALARAIDAELSGEDGTVAEARRKALYALVGAAGVSSLGLLLLLPAGSRPEPAAAAAAIPPRAQAAPPSLNLDDLDDFGVVSHATRAPAGTTGSEDEARVKPAASKFPPPKPLVGKVAVQAAGRPGPCRLVVRRPGESWRHERPAGTADARRRHPRGQRHRHLDCRSRRPGADADRRARLSAPAGDAPRHARARRRKRHRVGVPHGPAADSQGRHDLERGGGRAAVSPGGCVGVMAAEVKSGGEQQAALLAAATIIASQLATLVGPPVVRANAQAAS